MLGLFNIKNIMNQALGEYFTNQLGRQVVINRFKEEIDFAGDIEVCAIEGETTFHYSGSLADFIENEC